jgi:hypothetical protein
LETQCKLQSLDYIESFEHFDLLGDIEVRRVAGCIRESTHVGDRADESTEATIVAAELEDFLNYGAILALEFMSEHGWRDHVRTLFDIHAQTTVTVGFCGARDCPVQTKKRYGDASTWKLDTLGNFGNDANLGVPAAMTWHKQHLLVATRIE